MRKIKAPFFEIGPKSYLYGDDVLNLALAADAAAEKYDVDVIFTTPFTEIRRVAEATKRLFVFAPHMDPLPVGRGLADILPEAVKAAGAKGVMLNHCERPLTLSVLRQTILRAKALELETIVCADSIAEARAIAALGPDIIVAEPTELIGTGKASSMDYVRASIEAVKGVNPDILVLQGAGISNGQDVYNVIHAGAEATGSSSGIVKAPSPAAMVDEMLGAVRRAYDDRKAGR
ncbi:MAG: triose-phosphate isomerase [Clostridia bacterium]|nr:triose-phosphate isomerase [Clostridia bacterium]MBO4884131.1 triose-phosphate isomerase [Clostridia bacterium]